MRGSFYYLYMILDIYSRKIVGWAVYEQELATLAADVLQRAILAEDCVNRPLVLHPTTGRR